MKNEIRRSPHLGGESHASFDLVLVLSVTLLLAGCGGSTPGAKSAPPEPMNLAEARAFLVDVRAKRGLPPVHHAEVTSIEELLTILSSDDIGRFEDAARFVEGKPGVDALTLGATIELAWSDGFSMVALLANELAKRAAIEADRLDAKRDSGRDFTDADAKTLDETRKEALVLAKARGALQVLSEDHLRAGGSRVSEALRQFPQDPRTHRVAAYSYLLSGEWGQYDTAMTWFEGARATPDAGIQYMRAMEALKRSDSRKQTRALLEEALGLNPKMVRAQAALVLVQEEIGATHAELQKLEAMAPRHPVVSIAGPSINREYEFSTALSRVRAAEPMK
jgi:hypothetical protein